MKAEGNQASQRPERVPVIITSRMGSQRFPGKALALVAGTPVIQWVVEAVLGSRLASDVVVATSESAEDAAIMDWCRRSDVRCETGPLADVATRVAAVATRLKCERFVRISGDSPLIDPFLIDFAIELSSRADWDLVTNVYPRTFPAGESVEVVRLKSLLSVLGASPTDEQREHVTLGFYQRLVPAEIRNFDVEEVLEARGQVLSFLDESRLSAARLSVDYPDDLVRVAKIIQSMAPREPRDAGWLRCAAVACGLDITDEDGIVR